MFFTLLAFIAGLYIGVTVGFFITAILLQSDDDSELMP